MTAEHPSSRTGTGRHRTVPPDRARARRRPAPARSEDTGPTRRVREPAGPDGAGGSGPREPAARPERREPRRRAAGAPKEVRLPWPDRLLRGLSGVLAGGMVVLALGILVVWVGADRYGLPGPGAAMVIGHLVGAVVAVVGQRVADRRPDRIGTIAAVGVVGLVAFVLGFAWFL